MVSAGVVMRSLCVGDPLDLSFLETSYQRYKSQRSLSLSLARSLFSLSRSLARARARAISLSLAVITDLQSLSIKLHSLYGPRGKLFFRAAALTVSQVF